MEREEGKGRQRDRGRGRIGGMDGVREGGRGERVGDGEFHKPFYLGLLDLSVQTLL